MKIVVLELLQSKSYENFLNIRRGILMKISKKVRYIFIGAIVFLGFLFLKISQKTDLPNNKCI